MLILRKLNLLQVHNLYLFFSKFLVTKYMVQGYPCHGKYSIKSERFILHQDLLSAKTNQQSNVFVQFSAHVKKYKLT